MRALAIAFLLLSCSLDRSGIVEGDVGFDAGRGVMTDGGPMLRDAGRDCVPSADPDLCDDVDTDCDSRVDEDYVGGGACDADDDDACEDDRLACVSGAERCMDDGESATDREICDGVDNDCRSGTADGSDDPALGVACDGGDDDPCEEGVLDSCVGGNLVCGDATDNSDDDTCDGLDGDCDGAIDESADCPCTDVTREDGHAYFFCTDDLTWAAARDECEALGYHLAHIDDAEENQFIADNVPNGDHYWIGITDADMYSSGEDTWVWYDDPAPRAAALFQHWIDGQPDDFFDNEDCAELDRDRNEGGVDGAWNDERCANTGGQAYACEADP